MIRTYSGSRCYITDVLVHCTHDALFDSSNIFVDMKRTYMVRHCWVDILALIIISRLTKHSVTYTQSYQNAYRGSFNNV